MLTRNSTTLGFARANAAWLGAGFIFAFGSSFGQTFFLSLFGAEYRAEFGLSDGEWGTIYMVATLFSGAAIIFVGPLVDRFKSRDIAVATGLAFVFLALLIAVSPNWWVFAIAIMGLRFCGQGMFSHLSQTCMARWFAANRGRALAIAALGLSAGEAVLPSLSVALAEWVSWRSVWLSVALVILALLPILWRLLRRERTPASTLDSEQTPGLHGRHWTRADMLRHWSIFIIAPTFLAPGFVITAVFFQISTIAEDRSWDLALAAATYPLYAGAAVVAALITGVLVDRLTARALLPFYLLPMGAGAMLLMLESPWALVGLMACIGLTAGASSAIHSALLAELYGARHLGGIRSLAHAFMVGATALAPGLTGNLLDLGVSLPEQFVGMALYSFALSAILFFVIPRLHESAAEPTEPAP